MVIIRNLPIAPFTLVNMVAGASHVKFMDYILGTAVGMIPGILVITGLIESFILVVTRPDWRTIALAAGVVTALGIGMWWARKRISREGGK